MPYDIMDKFVALSKCLAGFPATQDSRIAELEDRTVKYMLRLLDSMDPQSGDAGDSAAEHVAKHGGVVVAPGVGVEVHQDGPVGLVEAHAGNIKPKLEKKSLSVLPVIRDTLFKQLKIVQDQFPRGVTFADVHPKYLDTLMELSNQAKVLAEVLKQYQQDVAAANQHFEEQDHRPSP